MTTKMILAFLLVVVSLQNVCAEVHETGDPQTFSSLEIHEYCPEECKCFPDDKKQLATIDCSNVDMNDVPHNLPRFATRLHMNGCNLPHLTYSFTSTEKQPSYILEVEMKDCHIKEVSRNTFSMNDKIIKIDLSYNDISGLTPEHFSDELKYLFLYRNPNCYKLKSDSRVLRPKLQVFCSPNDNATMNVLHATAGPTTAEPTATEPTATEPTKEENITEDSVHTTSMAPNTKDGITTTAGAAEKGSRTLLWICVPVGIVFIIICGFEYLY